MVRHGITRKQPLRSWRATSGARASCLQVLKLFLRVELLFMTKLLKTSAGQRNSPRAAIAPAKKKPLLSSKGRVLVTGAAGFIGSALVHELNARGITRIVVSDHLGTDKKWRNLAPLTFEDYIPP